MCVEPQNREKFTEILYFRGLRSSKVIDVDTPKKLVNSAYYGKQHSVLNCNHFRKNHLDNLGWGYAHGVLTS